MPAQQIASGTLKPHQRLQTKRGHACLKSEVETDAARQPEVSFHAVDMAERARLAVQKQHLLLGRLPCLALKLAAC